MAFEPSVCLMLSQISQTMTQADQRLIRKAMVYGCGYHSLKTRSEMVGNLKKEYFTHLVAVAGNLFRQGCDAQTVAAGFLHDVVEDLPEVTLADIVREFGPEIAFLVDAVTKDKSGTISPHQKLEEALGTDPRALFIKLADRTHNLETLVHMKDLDKERGKVEETLADYVPLARRWGQEDLAAALEGLAYRELARIERAGEWHGKG